MAGSIPIYYGNKRVTDEFNPNSFINCNDYDNDFEAIIKKVEEIDNDDNMARKMICTPPMKEGYDFDWRTKLGGFLECIIEKGNTPYIIGKSYNDTSAQNVEYVSDFTLNNEIYANAIIEKVKKYKSVMIYGDGKYANNLGTVLKKINEVTIKCFIVTNKQEGKDKLMGIPIIEFDEKVIDKNDLIMIAIREEAQESLIKKLWNNGYKNLMAVNDYIIGIIEKNCCNVGEVV
jgi:hypothetical protein